MPLLTRLATRPVALRAFSTSASARKDIIQELYLNELRLYKAPPQAKDAHVGAVKTFSAPSAPNPPSTPANLAAELAKYDASEPDIAADPVKSSTAGEPGAGGYKAFLALLEEDLPEPEAHH